MTIPPHYTEAGVLVHLAAEIKRAIDIPVIAIGKINTPELADQIISEGRADFVAMARALVADPYLPQKAMGGKREEIRRCIYCLEDCAQSGVPSLGRSCTVNPFAGQEYLMEIKPAGKKKKVVIVGGGPAGMQAAILASQRGHTVTLYEKNNNLGGQLRLAHLAPCKNEVAKLLEYLNYMLAKVKVRVITNKEAGIKEITAENPDAVILATGSNPRIPDIPGVDLPFVYSVRDVYENMPDLGKHIVVLGGGDIGCETADMLASEGKDITIVEILPEVLSNMKDIPKQDILNRLNRKKVKILIETRVESIKWGNIRIKDKNGERSSLPADSVILSVGSVPEDSRLYSLKKSFPEVYIVGDAELQGNAGSALRSAAKVALQI